MFPWEWLCSQIFLNPSQERSLTGNLFRAAAAIAGAAGGGSPAGGKYSGFSFFNLFNVIEVHISCGLSSSQNSKKNIKSFLYSFAIFMVVLQNNVQKLLRKGLTPFFLFIVIVFCDCHCPLTAYTRWELV